MPRHQKPLLDRLMNTTTGKVVHSSGYGEAQNPGRMGTTSTQSFRERLAVDDNREFVGRYRDARVMRESRNTLPQAKVYEYGARDSSMEGTRQIGDRGVGAPDGASSGAAERARMAARFEPTKPVGGGVTPPMRRNPGI